MSSHPWLQTDLAIDRAVLDEVLAHSVADYPAEACGFLVGCAEDDCFFAVGVAESIGIAEKAEFVFRFEDAADSCIDRGFADFSFADGLF